MSMSVVFDTCGTKLMSVSRKKIKFVKIMNRRKLKYCLICGPYTVQMVSRLEKSERS